MNRESPPNPLTSIMKNEWTQRIVVAAVSILLILSLWLPPASIGARLFYTDYPLIKPDEGGVATTINGATLHVPPDAVEKRTRFRMEAIAGQDLAAACGNADLFVGTAGEVTSVDLKEDAPEALAFQDIPQNLIAYEPLYRVDVRGDDPSRADLTLPIPDDLNALEMADLYAWDGQSWEWIPSRIDRSDWTLQADLPFSPSFFILAQTQATTPRIGFGISASADDLIEISADTAAPLVSISGLHLEGEGEIGGDLVASPDSNKMSSSLLSISNTVDGVTRSDLLDNLVIDDSLRTRHVENILQRVNSGEYTGVEIAYGGLDPDLEADFTAFIQELARALQAQDNLLAVRVDRPQRDGDGWDTGGYNWQVLGESAHVLRIPALMEPEAYEPEGDMDHLLSWATRRVDRRKLDLYMSGYSYEFIEDEWQQIPYQQALNLLARRIDANTSEKILSPGELVGLNLPDAAQASLQFDADAQVYSLTYQDEAQQTHRVLLQNAASVARRLQYVNRYALGGFSIEGALHKENDEGILTVVQSLQDNLVPPSTQFACVWTVEDASGRTIDQQVLPLTDPNWTWTAPNNPGNYIIRAAISDDGGQTTGESASQIDVEVPTPTFTPTNTPTPTPTSTPTATPTRSTATAESEAEAEEETQAAVSNVQPSAPGYFGYGIQAAMVTDGNHQRIFDHVNTMGFNWVKQQVEWFRYNPAPGQYDWGPLDRIVDSANANGVNVLFSVVKAPAWARPPEDTDEGPPADPNTYGDFVREMASRYKGRVKAYEIWNEQNLYYEWGGRGGKINAAQYMELLKVAYNAIKSVDPGAVVVSGALTPTGTNDGDIAIDDRVYLEQMYKAGLARYCDAIGAHPSGFNLPPDADWRTYEDPHASFRGPFTNRHPSYSFQATMESYRNIMVKYGDAHKRIWPTEFGWATVDGLGVAPAPNYEYAADNTEAEQAQYIVRAYEMSRSWGWVGPMFLWNLNFAPVAGAQDEKAAFGIVRDDWSPRPAFHALCDMPK
ncbi:MAG: cellulase family glycosylhydrolase [Anaerolineales bacterium]